MDDSYKKILKENLPQKIRVDSSVDFPELGQAKLRGVSPRWAWKLEWHYLEKPDEIFIETYGVNEPGISCIIPITELEKHIC